MCAELPQETESSEDAASGTRIHAVLAGEADISTLSAAEAETLEMCEAQARAIMAEWGGDSTLPIECQRVYTEQRLGMTALGRVIDVTEESKAEFIFTGCPDVVGLLDGRAIVIDYKTGRGEVAEAIENHQLAALAVLVALRHKVSEVRVAVVQPWAGKPTVSDYSEKALVLARHWLRESLNNAADSLPEDARAGDHCKYCRAQAHCWAFKELALQTVEVIQPMNIAGLDSETQRKAMFARAMELRPDALAATLRGLGMVERFVAAIKGAARERAANDPEFQRFYELKEKKGRRSISDVGKVFSACAAKGVTAQAFTAMCSIGLGDVKDLLKTATGAKGKALDAMQDEVIAGAVDTGKPSMELVAVNSLEGVGE